MFPRKESKDRRRERSINLIIGCSLLDQDNIPRFKTLYKKSDEYLGRYSAVIDELCAGIRMIEEEAGKDE